MTERPDLRIGDRDRDAVVSRLQQAHAEGRIDLSELDERVSAALAARFAGDLAALVADLPSAEEPAGTMVRPSAGPGHSPDDPLRLDGGWSNLIREGVWVIPPFLRVDPQMGWIKLNCLQAITEHPVIMIEMVPSIGNTHVILPEGWVVDLDRLSVSWGSSRVRSPGPPVDGAPILRFVGGVGMGSLKVRPGKRRELRRSRT